MVKVQTLNAGSVSVAAWIVALYFLTFSVNSSIDVSLLVLLVGAAWIQIGGKSHRIKFNAVDAAAAGFVLALLLSTAFSENIAKRLLLSTAFVPAILLYFLIRHCRGNPDLVVVLLSLLAQIIYLSALAALAAYTASIDNLTPAEVIEQIQSIILIVPNDVVLFALTLPLFLSLKDISKNHAITTVVVIALALVAVAVISLQSRLAVLTAGLVILCYYFLRQRRISVIFALGFLALVVLVDAAFDFALTRKVLAFSDSRIPLWYAAWGMFAEQPLTGFGAHTFGDFYQSYFVSDGFAQNIIVDNRHTPWPHNLYLELLAEYGLLGFSGFIALVVVVARQLLTKVLQHDDHWHAIYCALMATMAGFLFAAFFELTLLRLWVVTFMFLLLSLIAFVIEQTLPVKDKERSATKSSVKKNRSRTVNSV
jgi:O-antigen ligase